jgi:adenylate cyclase
VNTASRIEAMTKEYAAQLVLSEDVADKAGVDLTGFPAHELAVRGRSEPIRAIVVARTADLPPRHTA